VLLGFEAFVRKLASQAKVTENQRRTSKFDPTLLKEAEHFSCAKE
jgi:hypothetical protein